MSKIDKLIENGVKSLVIENLEEKAVSKNQQQFMGMVHAYKKGEMKDAPASVKKAAKGMTKKAAKDFASIKHKGLPTKVNEGVMSELDVELQDATTFEEFIANVKFNPKFKDLDIHAPDVQKFLSDLFRQQKNSLNERKMKTKTESIVKRLKKDTEYQKFFRSAMDRFGVKSPKELSKDKKKEFFNYVDKNYTAKNENRLREDYFPAHSTDSGELKNAKAALANWFKNIKLGKVSPQSALRLHHLHHLNDLIEDYAEAYASDAMNQEDYR